MLGLLVTILVMCIIFGLIWWIISVIPLPPPFARIAQVVCVVLFCLWLIYLILPLAGGGFGHPLPGPYPR
jgi:hypothetical protein